MKQLQLRDFEHLGEGNLHIVFKYVGEQPELKDKVFRIAKKKSFCPISNLLLGHYQQTQWSPIKQYFCPKSPFQWDGHQGELMQNLFHGVQFAIELKPKTYLPILSSKQEDKDLTNIKNTRFFKMQLSKAKKKNTLPSIYDPRKFYSGKLADLREALLQLQHIPENNFRLFNYSAAEITQDDVKSRKIKFQIADIVSQTLFGEQIIPILKQFFQMVQAMNLTAEEALDAYEYVQKRGLTEEDAQQLAGNAHADFELKMKVFTLLLFSTFQALSDCSIIGSFWNEEFSGTRLGERDLPEFEHKGRRFRYAYHVVDCDLKPFTKIHDYLSSIDELLSLC